MIRNAPAMLAMLLLSGCLANTITEPPPVGLSFEEQLVWPTPSTLVVEIHYVEGREPTDMALQALEETLRHETMKERIVIREPTLINAGEPSSQRVWDPDEVERLSQEYGSPPNNSSTAWLHALFLDGKTRFSNGQEGIGFFRAPFIAMFPDAFRYQVIWVGPVGPFGTVGIPNNFYEQGQAFVVKHELGHALGLVDNGAPMTSHRVTNDPCRCHSTNEESVMYVGPEDMVEMERLIEKGHRYRLDFDEDDKADLAALRDLWLGGED